MIIYGRLGSPRRLCGPRSAAEAIALHSSTRKNRPAHGCSRCGWKTAENPRNQRSRRRRATIEHRLPSKGRPVRDHHARGIASIPKPPFSSGLAHLVAGPQPRQGALRPPSPPPNRAIARLLEITPRHSPPLQYLRSEQKSESKPPSFSTVTGREGLLPRLAYGCELIVWGTTRIGGTPEVVLEVVQRAPTYGGGRPKSHEGRGQRVLKRMDEPASEAEESTSRVRCVPQTHDGGAGQTRSLDSVRRKRHAAA